jgi:hypothetical protein
MTFKDEFRDCSTTATTVFHVVQKQLQLKDTINNGVALSPFEIRS